MRDAAPAAVGGYRLGRRLAGNQAGGVFEAQRDGTRYALKCVFDKRLHFERRDRLAAEYRAGLAFQHPCITAPRAWIEAPGHAAIVFDYLAGGDLAGLAGFPPAAWSGALLDLHAALDYMHGLGVAHADVKARNVMLDADDRACLIDLGSCRPFGSARSFAGTTAMHRPPDTDGRVSADDDRYAYCVLVHEMLTGALPRPGRHAAEEAMQGSGPAALIGATVREALAASATARAEKLRSLTLVLESISGQAATYRGNGTGT